MKIFTYNQIKELDRYTMEHEPIRSIDLMERAAKALSRTIMDNWTNRTPVVVFAGPGNNGGDAMAVARMLAEQNYAVSVYLFNISDHLSEDCVTNRQRVVDCKQIKEFVEVTTQFDPPVLEADMLVIDGLFGSGINKPLAGGFASLVKYINQSPSTIVSIDMPSGLMPEDNSYNVSANIIRADMTLTLQQKKLSFLFADCQQFIGKLRVLDIRLSKDYIEKTDARYATIEENYIRSKIKQRDDFAHKGNMGNALIIAGSYGMAGAAVLATEACLRAGAGKVTIHTPKRNYNVLQTSVPEAVMQIDREETYFSEAVDAEDFDAVGIGPGLGQHENTAIALITQLRRSQCPIVVDADGLNMLTNHRAWMQQLPKGIILTPHPKEFDRIVGTSCNGEYERLHKAQEMAENLHAFILLKGHYSALCMPDGHILFNTTGNSGMATAGSGDVLTGIITGLLARGYNAGDACTVGMYLHGLAGDLAAKDLGKESLIARDIIKYLPHAFKRLEE
ncbi:MAG: NAD(P)H-hydrate dehydratase [Prevotella sp.]|nr:NAD(P)H-hydrate dehydratase [Prevotella sp.]